MRVADLVELQLGCINFSKSCNKDSAKEYNDHDIIALRYPVESYRGPSATLHPLAPSTVTGISNIIDASSSKRARILSAEQGASSRESKDRKSLINTVLIKLNLSLYLLQCMLHYWASFLLPKHVLHNHCVVLR